MNKPRGQLLFSLTAFLLVFSLILFPTRSAFGYAITTPDEVFPEMDVQGNSYLDPCGR